MCVGFIQIQAMLHKGLEHPWLLVFRDPCTNPPTIPRKTVIWEQPDGRDT